MPSARAVWHHETDFSDWLASSDGLEVLERDLGIRMAYSRREDKSTDFRSDFVGHLRGNSDIAIVVENQFGRTNHSHLGQVLTYAAANKAQICVWIAEESAVDHRRVVAWLNDTTVSGQHFYLAEISDAGTKEGRPTCRLNAVVRPETTPDSFPLKVVPNDAWCASFWSQVTDQFRDRGIPFSLDYHTDEWHGVETDLPGITFYLSGFPKDARPYVACELFIISPDRQSIYQSLFDHRQNIEAEIGEKLDWRQDVPKFAASAVILTRRITQREIHYKSPIVSWLCETFESFYKAFAPRLNRH